MALDHRQFQPLFDLTDAELERKGMRRMIADEKPGFPCRVSLEDADIGEEVLALSYEFHSPNSPYRAHGPIFVRKDVSLKKLEVNEVPAMLAHRLLSFRGYDRNGMMIEARTEKGIYTAGVIEQIFNTGEVEYIHIHNASPGCFNCEVQRVK